VLTGVIMAGGRGERFGDPEKCLAPVCGIPLLFRVAGALAQVVDKLYVATTPRHRGVAAAAAKWGIDVIYTPGLGYEHDFVQLAAYAPAVVAACDIADLTPSHVLKLTAAEVFATAASGGEYVGLSYIHAPTSPGGWRWRWAPSATWTRGATWRRRSGSAQWPTPSMWTQPR